MAKSDPFIIYLQEEIFRDISGIAFKSMFGGYGIYCHGQIFGLISNDTVYFKVDLSNLSDYQTVNSHPFKYLKNNKSYTMSYWQVPEYILNDSDKLKTWVNKSLQVKR